MATVSKPVSRWGRGFVVASTIWLVVWQLAVLVGITRRSSVTLGLFGFVFHMVFGKAYSLIPSYFDRELAVPQAPALHLPLAVVGTAMLTVAPLSDRLASVGAVLWTAGVCIFLGILGWTLRDNPTGRETGTGEHNAERRSVDRMANAVLPIALAYLAVGTYGLLATQLPLPTGFDGSVQRLSHLLAAGTTGLLVFGIGFRLLPRFLGATPPEWLVALVLSTGVLGPGLIAAGLPSGRLLLVGALFETVALTGFAAGFGWLFYRSERRRIGLHGVLGGALAGLALVGLGGLFALAPGYRSTLLVTAHYRLAILGFLGLTIAGIGFQFYPPGITRVPAAGDRFATGVLVALAGGLAVEVSGYLIDTESLVIVGQTLGVAGAIGYAYLLIGLFFRQAAQ